MITLIFHCQLLRTLTRVSFFKLSGTDLLTISFEMAYGKSLLKSVKMKTQSGPVLYTNLLGLVPMLLFATAGGEFGHVQEKRQEATLFTGTAIVLLALGSVAGTGIGYSSWWCVYLLAGGLCHVSQSFSLDASLIF